MDHGLAVGAAKRILPVAQNVHLSGYGGRVQPAVGCIDPVYSRVVIVRTDETNLIVLCSVDVLGFDLAHARQARRAVAQDLGISASRVLIAGTHTHAGPATQYLRHCGTVAPTWRQTLTDVIRETTIKAVERIVPARFTGGFGTAPIAVNRRVPDGAVDRNVGTWGFFNEEGAPVAILAHFGCHPTVLGPKNRRLSAEFPGRVLKHLERMYPDAVGCFLTGACGDVKPKLPQGLDGRRAVSWSDENRGVGLMEWMGETLAKQVGFSLNGKRRDVSTLKIAEERVRLPLSPPPDVEELRVAAKQGETLKHSDGGCGDNDVQERVPNPKYALAEWARETMQSIRSGDIRQSVEVDLQAIRFGDWCLVAIPGEVFASIGLEIKKRLAPHPALVCGYANGNVGYLPTKAAHETDWYEVKKAHKYYGFPGPFSPETESLLVSEVESLAKQLFA